MEDSCGKIRPVLYLLGALLVCIRLARGVRQPDEKPRKLDPVEWALGQSSLFFGARMCGFS
jgi:hypothetical protein